MDKATLAKHMRGELEADFKISRQTGLTLGQYMQRVNAYLNLLGSMYNDVNEAIAIELIGNYAKDSWIEKNFV